MFAYIILACHVSITSVSLDCSWKVKKVFETEQACDVFENGYVLSKGEQLGICDSVEPGTKAGDKRPALVIKK